MYRQAPPMDHIRYGRATMDRANYWGRWNTVSGKLAGLDITLMSAIDQLTRECNGHGQLATMGKSRPLDIRNNVSGIGAAGNTGGAV